MKILYVTTLSGTINAFLIPHIRMLVELGHSVDIACKITKSLKQELYDIGCNIYDVSFNRSPLKSDNYNAYKVLKELIKKEKYDIVHTHTPVASAISRLACKNIKVTKVFYTAHGFHFHKGAPIKNWMFYYPLEKWLSKYTDVLITINKEDFKRAKSKFKAKKVKYIPGVGLDIDRFHNVVIDKENKRKEIGVPKDGFIILSVGELNRNKNHEVIIRAIAELNNPKIHYVICGTGPLSDYLKKISIELGFEENLHLLGFRKDIAEICRSSDLFAFPSLREGLGMAALEAMACGLPIITSNIHGIVDYSIDGITGYCNKPKDVEGFSIAIEKLVKDREISSNFGKCNEEIVKKYNIKNVIIEINKIYKGNI